MVFSRTCLFTVHILIVANSTNDDLGHPPQTSNLSKPYSINLKLLNELIMIPPFSTQENQW